MSLNTLNPTDKNIVTAGPDQPAGTSVGENAADLAGFHGAACAQRASALQAALPSNATLADVIAAHNEIRAALVEKGLIKGAA